MRKFVLILAVIILITSVSGYFYFDKKFTPPENNLEVSEDQDTLDIQWVSNEDTEFAALLVPVNIEGVPNTFYLQFDLGAHSTLFHEKALSSISEKYPFFDSSSFDNNNPFRFNLGMVSVSIPKVRRLNYGQEINWKGSDVNIIGTLGADILEHKVVLMDFKKNCIGLRNTFPTEIPMESIQDFEFTKRKVMLQGQINSERTKFFYDSGSSAFELITDKDQWENLALFGAVEKVYQANSWGSKLDVHNIASDAVITFGLQEIPLSKVTYIEGTSLIQNVLMYFSGMGGMIGNKLFIGKVLILDAKNQKFAVL
ncbi:hypothetical protein SAMN05661096_02479 [Marivirga sericea]|uniref:Aspartyl protease n=1 Tax=Marivirga sericea TaxID=1028 RepID=A0A1X7KAA7_9BACT|nr:hypothetical protein [Marivirga sericea]SMG37783.1 hypothetical protein SAMN05661096_02479 [Marivirga sericea]